MSFTQDAKGNYYLDNSVMLPDVTVYAQYPSGNQGYDPSGSQWPSGDSGFAEGVWGIDEYAVFLQGLGYDIQGSGGSYTYTPHSSTSTPFSRYTTGPNAGKIIATPTGVFFFYKP